MTIACHWRSDHRNAAMLEAAALPIEALLPERFAAFGQVIQPRRVGGQFVRHDYNPATNPDEAQLVLGQGATPRLWLMHLGGPLLGFTTMARHMRVSQCLGALGGQEWLLAVAAPGATPAPGDVVAFRIPGDVVIKLHPGTWHAGPHFTTDECMFFNLENMDTNKADFEPADLGVELRYVLA
jgi:ureidoglycolate hydrolase